MLLKVLAQRSLPELSDEAMCDILSPKSPLVPRMLTEFMSLLKDRLRNLLHRVSPIRDDKLLDQKIFKLFCIRRKMSCYYVNRGNLSYYVGTVPTSLTLQANSGHFLTSPTTIYIAGLALCILNLRASILIQERI